MKILLAIDGSEISLRAVKHVIALAKQLSVPPTVLLTCVDPPLLQGAAAKMGATAVARYHQENFEGMSQGARRALTRAKLAFEDHQHVGEAASTLLAVAKKQRVDQIVMGSHGNGPIRGMFLGSVSAKVIANATVPVTIVR